MLYNYYTDSLFCVFLVRFAYTSVPCIIYSYGKQIHIRFLVLIFFFIHLRGYLFYYASAFVGSTDRLETKELSYVTAFVALLYGHLRKEI